MKWVRFIAGSAAVVAAAVIAAVQLGGWELARLRVRVDELEQEKTRLVEYARRLSASRRVAQVTVLEQSKDLRSSTVTKLRWQEIGADGGLGAPIEQEVMGSQIYFEAYVIKFELAHVAEGDPQRGASLALFRRVFGDQQSPESAASLDRSHRPPMPDDKENAALHEKLWARFWELAEDPTVAARYGVRVAQIEAPAVVMRPGQVWEVSLDAAGGLNVRKLQ